MFPAQAVVAIIYLFSGSPAPWRSAAPWWTVYGTLVDLGCLAMLWRFTRAEGRSFRDLVGPVRWQRGRDFFAGLAYFALVFPLFIGAGMLTALFLYGSVHATPHPGQLSARVLPAWAVLYSFTVWWLVWSTTEEMTYQGYVLPRIEALSRRTWLALVIVAFWWALQHSFLPFVPDLRSIVWRFLAFLPGAAAMAAIYLRTRRLAPLIVAHWLMDIGGAAMTICA